MAGEPEKEELLFWFWFGFFFFFFGYGTYVALKSCQTRICGFQNLFLSTSHGSIKKKKYFLGRDESLCFLHPHLFLFFFFGLCSLLLASSALLQYLVPTTRFDFCEILKKKQGVNDHLCPRLRNVHFGRMDPNGQTPQNPVISNKGIRGAAEVRNFKCLFAISNPNQNYLYRTVSIPLFLCFQFT